LDWKDGGHRDKHFLPCSVHKEEKASCSLPMLGQKVRGTQKGNKTTLVPKPCIEVCGVNGAGLSAGYRPCHVEVTKGGFVCSGGVSKPDAHDATLWYLYFKF
jgi:hypothetical protein